MKKIKKLSVVIVALAICILFTGTVWAQGTGTNVFGSSLDKTALHVSDQVQTVTLTIKAPQNVNLLGAKGTVYISDNTLECSINCFNETAGEYDENGKEFMWFDAEVEGVAVTTLVTVEVTIPAGYVGSVLIGLSELQYVASLDAANGTVDEVVASNLIETLVVSKHSFGTKASEQIVTPATCVTPAIYKVQCDYCSVVSETLTVSAGTPDANAHAYSTEISGYTVNDANGTHTAYYVCTHNAEHKKYDAAVAHDFTTGDCVCGQPKPVTNVTVTYKGAALASAYSVNGQTVTVTHTAACKVGYWDATNSKYVAIPAVATGTGSYTFTAPSGVTEVILAVKGDVNGDCIINAGDAGTINAHALGRRAMTAEQQFIADVQAPIGTINAADAGSVNADSLKRKALAW